MATIIVNPGQSIQAAINIAQPGDTIQVNTGTYTVSEMGITFPISGTATLPIKVIGIGNPIISGTWTGEKTSVFDIHKSYITIDGFILKNANTLISAVNNIPAIQGITVKNISGSKCSHVIFVGNFIKYSLFENITADATNHNSLYVFGNTNGSTSDIENKTTHHVTLKNCKVINAGHSGIDIYGMQGWLHDITIDGCILINSNIFFHDDPTMYNILIRKCDISGIINPSLEAIQSLFYNSRLEYNYIHDNAGYGYESDVVMHNNILYANRIVRNWYGVSPQGNTVFESNDITNNPGADYKPSGWSIQIKNAIGLNYTLLPTYNAKMTVSYTDGRTFNGGLTSNTYTTPQTIIASAAGTLPSNGGTQPIMTTLTVDKGTVQPGETIIVTWTNASLPNDSYISLLSGSMQLDWWYLDGSKDEMVIGSSNAYLYVNGSISIVMPTMEGVYTVAFYDPYQVFVTSVSVTVTIQEPPCIPPECSFNITIAQ